MKKNNSLIYNISALWLMFFFVASLIALIFQKAIQTHHVEQSLQFGFDPFGRNCLLLTFNAATKSLIEITPIGISCLIFSLLLSFFSLVKQPFFTFIWTTIWETIYSLPGFFISISLAAFFPTSALAFPIAILFLLTPYLIRFFEGQIEHVTIQEYYQQAIALGLTPFQLFRNYILPELLKATGAILPFLITRLLIIDTSLTFIGIKQPSRTTSWGELLFMGKDYLLEAPWISFFTALPLFLTLFSFHLISKNEPS